MRVAGALSGRPCSETPGKPAGRTGGAGGALLVDGDVPADDDAVAAVPGGALDPREGVEQRRGPAVAGVDVVHALEVEVAVLVEELAPVLESGRRLFAKGSWSSEAATHRVVLTDFDLSMIVSVPTSRRPTSVGAMLYFSRRF